MPDAPLALPASPHRRAALVAALNVLGGWLARRDVPGPGAAARGAPADHLVLLGSSLPETARVAARWYHAGAARRVLVCGGEGHATAPLRAAVAVHPAFGDVPVEGRSEAAILRDVLVRHLGVPGAAVLTEDRSTNCGSNAVEARRVLDTAGGSAGLVLVQDPTMQRRSHACFERAWRDAPDVPIRSCAPFVPELLDGPSGPALRPGPDPRWPLARFVSLVVGELARLTDDEHGYGPRGRDFFDHVEMPEPVLAAAAVVREELPDVSR